VKALSSSPSTTKKKKEKEKETIFQRFMEKRTIQLPRSWQNCLEGKLAFGSPTYTGCLPCPYLTRTSWVFMHFGGFSMSHGMMTL
jgi:hypothetical protein